MPALTRENQPVPSLSECVGHGADRGFSIALYHNQPLKSGYSHPRSP